MGLTTEIAARGQEQLFYNFGAW